MMNYAKEVSSTFSSYRTVKYEKYVEKMMIFCSVNIVFHYHELYKVVWFSDQVI